MCVLKGVPINDGRNGMLILAAANSLTDRVDEVYRFLQGDLYFVFVFV